MLPAWDKQVPNMELPADRTKATSRYYGIEAAPGKAGFVRDFVELGLNGVEEHLPEALCVPQSYWVPLCIINWSISINQHVHGHLMELARSSSNKGRKAECARYGSICLRRLWWYIRCRDQVRDEIQSDTQVDVVGSLNELVWREWNNWVEEEPPVEEISFGATVQKMAFGALFNSNGGFIGELSVVHAYLLCLMQGQMIHGARMKR